MSLGRAAKSYRDGFIHQSDYKSLNDVSRWMMIQAKLWIPSEEEMARLVEIDAQRRADVLRADAERQQRRVRTRERWFGVQEE